MALDWHHTLHNSEKPEPGTPWESTQNRHHRFISKWQFGTKKLPFEINVKVPRGKDVPISASTSGTSISGGTAGRFGRISGPISSLCGAKDKDGGCTAGDLHHCRPQVWEQIFPASNRPAICTWCTEGGRSNATLCGAIPLPGWTHGQGKLLAHGTNPGARQGLEKDSGPWDSGRAAPTGCRCTKYTPTCFSTPLKVGFSPCCCGAEELPALHICTMLPQSARLPSTSWHICTNFLPPACSNRLGPPPCANEHRARGGGTRQLGSTCPDSFPRAVPSPAAPTRRGCTRGSATPGALSLPV